MHPRTASLVAFCDAEAGADRGRRIAAHLSKCEACSEQVRRIRGEKDDLAARAAAPAEDSREDLDGVLSAMTAWREGRASEVASELKNRLRDRVETYFGSPAILVVERPGISAEELLGRAGEMFEVFLGPEAAEAVRDDVLRKLDWAEIFR